jgi:hypothetical protein
MLGGITGYNAVDTTDENPERVATIQRLTLAYLRSTLYSGDPAWSEACAAFADLKELGHIESKRNWLNLGESIPSCEENGASFSSQKKSTILR